MARTKILITLHPDVITLIDERAAWHRMNRSAYIAARCLGIIGDPGDKEEPEPDPAIARAGECIHGVALTKACDAC